MRNFKKFKRKIFITLLSEAFGVEDGPSQEDMDSYTDKIIEHVKDPSTIMKEGTFKKNIEVTHFFNKNTNVNVIILKGKGKEPNTFLSGWKLTNKQIKNIETKGDLN